MTTEIIFVSGDPRKVTLDNQTLTYEREKRLVTDKRSPCGITDSGDLMTVYTLEKRHHHHPIYFNKTLKGTDLGIPNINTITHKTSPRRVEER